MLLLEWPWPSPELPAMPAADLGQRQIWWSATALVTGIGLALLVFKQSLPLAILAVALLVAPHLVGAPQPESFESPVPHSLAHAFLVMASVTSFVFWVVLGGVAGFARSRVQGVVSSDTRSVQSAPRRSVGN